MVGAKFEIVLRTRFVKNTPLRKPLRIVARVKVVEAQVSVSKALVSVDAGEVKVFPTFVSASTTKITLISVEKISSVKRVRYFTKFDADVTDDKKRMAEVQRPVQAVLTRSGATQTLQRSNKYQ